MDNPCFGWVAHEASFDENGGMLDGGQDGEARAFDATIGDACRAGALEGAPVDGSGERDVGRVLVVALAYGAVGASDATSVVSDSDRREGESLEPACAASPARIEVDGNKDCIRVAVCECHPLREGEVAIRLAGHDDIVALFLKMLADFFGDDEVIAGFGSVLVHGAGIFTAVAWVDDDGAEISGAGYVCGTHYGVDEFGEIGA